MSGKGKEFIKTAAKVVVNHVGVFVGDVLYNEERFFAGKKKCNILTFPRIIADTPPSLSEETQLPGPNVIFLNEYRERKPRRSSS